MDEVIPGFLDWPLRHPSSAADVSSLAHGMPIAVGGKAVLVDFVASRR